MEAFIILFIIGALVGVATDHVVVHRHVGVGRAMCAGGAGGIAGGLLTVPTGAPLPWAAFAGALVGAVVAIVLLHAIIGHSTQTHER